VLEPGPVGERYFLRPLVLVRIDDAIALPGNEPSPELSGAACSPG